MLPDRPIEELLAGAAAKSAFSRDGEGRLQLHASLAPSRPVLVIGMPMCGNLSLHDAFETLGLRSVHGTLRDENSSDGPQLVGKVIQEAVQEGLAPLEKLEGTDAVADMAAVFWVDENKTKAEGFFPQMSLLERLIISYPHGRFVLNVCDPREWARAVQLNADLHDRLVAANLPGLPRGTGRQDRELIDWMESHHLRVRKTLGRVGAMLYVHDTARHGLTELSEFLGTRVGRDNGRPSRQVDFVCEPERIPREERAEPRRLERVDNSLQGLHPEVDTSPPLSWRPPGLHVLQEAWRPVRPDRIELGPRQGPVLVMGLPRSGSKRLHRAFQHLGLRSVHWALNAGVDPRADFLLRACGEGAGRRLVGKLVHEAVSEGLLPLAKLPDTEAVAEMAGVFWVEDRVEGYFPQISFFDIILAAYPHGRFILNVCDPLLWVDYVGAHTDLRDRLVRADLPGLPAGAGKLDLELADWAARYYRQAHSFLTRMHVKFLVLVEGHCDINDLASFLR